MSLSHLFDLTRRGNTASKAWTAAWPWERHDSASMATLGSGNDWAASKPMEPSGGTGLDEEFELMRGAYGATGGTVCADDVAQLMHDHQRGDFVALAKLIVSGGVFGFEWQHTFWIPMFQFDLGDLSVRPEPQQVLAELASEFDGWTLAMWFAQPNAWLNERRPVDVLGSDVAAVVEAARADRFIATR